MIRHWILLLISCLFVHIHADTKQSAHLILQTKEHQPNEISPKNFSDSSSEKILIRYD